MPRGIGGRFYCSFNEFRAFSYSFVEVYLQPELWATPIHYGLWAYMNSSFVWLYREITGRKNLGGGMLKAEATDLKTLPLGIDFSALSRCSSRDGSHQNSQTSARRGGTAHQGTPTD